jgi:hypothetical protein
MEIEELGERLYVLDGVIEYRIPFKLGGSSYIASDSHLRAQPLTDTEFEIEVTVRYQACNDRECYPPKEQRLTIALSESTRP